MCYLMCLRDRVCFLKVSVEEESASIGLAWFHGPWKFKFYTRDIFVWRTIGRICLVKARFLVLIVLSQVCRIRKTQGSHSFFGCYGLSMTLRIPIRYCFLMIKPYFNRHSWQDSSLDNVRCSHPNYSVIHELARPFQKTYGR